MRLYLWALLTVAIGWIDPLAVQNNGKGRTLLYISLIYAQMEVRSPRCFVMNIYYAHCLGKHTWST
jgi:hypothetical protein